MANIMSWIDVRPYVDLTVERALLGLVLHLGRIPPALRQLRPICFHDQRHAALWTTILALHEADPHAEIDRTAVLTHLQAGPDGDDRVHPHTRATLDYIHTLSDLRPNPDFAPLWVDRLLNLHNKRAMWALALRFLELLRDNVHTDVTPHELRRRLVTALDSLDFSTPHTEPATWADLQDFVGPIRWDWPGWLPRGYLVLLAGQSGIGKSLLALRLAACYLRGDPWPDACLPTPETGRPLLEGSLQDGDSAATPSTARAGESSLQDCDRLAGGESALAASESAVLWCESETAQYLNLQRARAWGLPCERIWAPLTATQDVHLGRPDHRAAIARRAADPRVSLVVVDSLAGVSQASPRPVQSPQDAVQWLAELARDTGKPVLLLHHLRKDKGSPGARSVPLESLRGHSSIVQPARIVLALDAPDPIRPHVKRLAVIKSNLAACPPPLGFYVASGASGDGAAGGPQVRFCAPPHPPQATTLLEQAVLRLRELLSTGPVPATLIHSKLGQDGISKRTAYRAKAYLGIRSSLRDHLWFWHLPSDPAQPPLLDAPPPDPS